MFLAAWLMALPAVVLPDGFAILLLPAGLLLIAAGWLLLSNHNQAGERFLAAARSRAGWQLRGTLVGENARRWFGWLLVSIGVCSSLIGTLEALALVGVYEFPE